MGTKKNIDPESFTGNAPKYLRKIYWPTLFQQIDREGTHLNSFCEAGIINSYQ